MKTYLIAFIFISFTLITKAHEGMWIPSLLKALEGDMQSKGLKLSAEDIYAVNHSSLKDAIVHFGGGCTAEVVSKEGLILTNHHCGYSQIQAHSSLENDYLTHGFWAMNRDQELPNSGLTATFIVRIEDVTDRMKVDDKNLSNQDLFNFERQKMKEIEDDAVKGTNYEAFVRPFDYGNSYYLIVTKTFLDVRLVGAPPSEIGKFGGDTDNWVWPRHTGDFSVFRIYSNKENEPAEYSKENIPYHPAASLPVSMEELKEKDFTMVFGFPGQTEQHLTSHALDNYLNKIVPIRLAMREASLGVIDAAMKSSNLLFIKYAAKQSRISNAYKKWVGQELGLKKKDALGKKQAFEAEYLKRVPKDGPYKNVYSDLKKLQDEQGHFQVAQTLFSELYYYGPELLRYANRFRELKGAKYEEVKTSLLKGVESYFKDYDAEVDQKIFAKLVALFFRNLPDDLQIKVGETIKNKFKGDFELYATYVYEKSNLTSVEKVEKFLNSSKKNALKKLELDPAYILVSQLIEMYESKIKTGVYDFYLQDNFLMRKFVAAKKEYFPENQWWSDANSTLRLTYGKAEGTYPRDGMRYTWYTTLDGIIEKNNTGNDDFHIPVRLRKLWEEKKYGKYAVNNELRVCFLGSNHTTGGNSGSPALNSEGHLIGINFDRSWESTMSDLMFDSEICRNIMVDIKYVLWVIDVYAGAGHLVDEMELVDEKWRAEQRLKNLKASLNQYNNRLRDVPNDLYALLGRAEIYQQLGQIAESGADLELAIKSHPKSTTALNMRAAYFEKKGMYVAAISDIEASLKINSTENIEAYFIRGLLFADNLKYQEAISDFSKVIALDYSFYKAYYDRGICYQAIGDIDEACRNFELAKSLGDPSAQKMYHLNCEFGAW